MYEANTLQEINKSVQDARNLFYENLDESQKELEEIFTYTYKLFQSVSKFYQPNGKLGKRYDYILSILMQSIETLLAMYYMIESGFGRNSLTLRRNYVELMMTSIAIGYDNQCYIDWKNNRGSMRGFNAISKRIEESNSVPDLEKKIILP
jgi:hypothetical protein